MHSIKMKTVKRLLLVAAMSLAFAAQAQQQDYSQRQLLPPPGPYMSSRPLLMPRAGVEQQQQRANERMAIQQPMPHPQQRPMMPSYGYPQAGNRQAYPAPMPYNNGMQPRNQYQQPAPWQTPYNVPQRGGWHW